MITGTDILNFGYKPGKWFKEAIEFANANNLEGKELEDYLKRVSPPQFEPFAENKPFYVNIIAENELEEKNVAIVTKTMVELMKTPTMVKGAIMPDACPTGEIGQIPVGGIAVARNAIHPAMHSADICCSMMMSSIGKFPPEKVLDIAQDVTHFGGLDYKTEFELPKGFNDKIKNNKFLNNPKSIAMSQQHFGTQGDGNHFLFVGISKNTGETVIVTHHGSRGFGAQLFNVGMKTAEYFRKDISPKTLPVNAWIPYETEEGKSYWEALQVVREWTKANHSVIHDNISKKLNSEITSRLWNEHNFVFKDGDLFYHAKGATPLDKKFLPDAENDLRIVPLNMNEPILIIKGETNEQNLGFAPHGAGRNMSRNQHIRENVGKTKEEIFNEETKNIDVRFYSGHIDISELPSAYKNAAKVREQMEYFKLGTVVDEIIPYGCIMAGDWQVDAPWRNKKKKNEQE